MFYRGTKKHLLFLLLPVCAGILLLGVLLYQELNGTIHLTKPPATALLEDRYGRFLAEFSGVDPSGELGYWDVPYPIPPRVETAFLITEDRRFHQHAGIDWRAVIRAVWSNLTTTRRQGASTIAMQVARMQRSTLTENQPPARTYWQKFCEGVTALLLIRNFGHQAVLQHYLALVPQGNRIHGVAYAARRYFQKPLQDLSWAEAALLAALPKAPGHMNLFRDKGRQQALSRAEVILETLKAFEKLTDQELLNARRQLAHLSIPEREQRPAHSYHAILRLEDLLREQDEQTYSRPVRASLNLQIQDKVAEITHAAISHYRASGAGNIAAMVVETSSGNVVAYIGSDEYYNTTYAGAINYARVPRSSGSTLKPFIFALGLERNLFSPASVLSDLPILVALPRGYHRIGNYDGQNLGPLLYRRALANSRNVPAVHVLATIGIDHAYDLFRQLKLTSRPRSAEHYGVGMAIGTLYVTLEDLVRAYGVLANEGQTFNFRWFDTHFTQNSPGQGLPILTSDRILDAGVTRQISLFLSDPLARLPTFSRMGPLEYPFPVAIKTGTSQGFRDAWAMAYSGKYIAGVWIGHPENTRMRDVSGVSAAQVLKEIMLFLHPEERRGVAEHPFQPPEQYTLVDICALTGKPATGRCPDISSEYFRPGTEPVSTQTAVYHASSIQADSATSDAKSVSGSISLNPLALISSPFSFETLLNASITIRQPTSGATFVLDPDTPPGMQTLPFYASATPAVSQLVWYVDGKPFTTASYPYTIRWPLTPGIHTIQARFAYADIASDTVTITVY